MNGPFSHRLRTWGWLALLVWVLPNQLFAQSATGVGFQPISVSDPVTGETMPGYLFFPSEQSSQLTQQGPYELHATLGGAITAGAKPLVVVSHGHGGSNLGHHDLAVHLARHGFLVATLEHPKDNFHDTSGTGTAAVLLGRPTQVKATINALLDDSRWQPFVDPDRIGVIGFSAGGYTALLLSGALPRFSRTLDYCKQQPQDVEICGPLNDALSQGTASAKLTALQSAVHKWGAPRDPRVRAAFLMAPLSLLFDKASLQGVKVPIYLYYSQEDEVLLPSYNALHIAPLLETLAGTKAVAGAGHYVFLSPCSPAIAKAAPKLCKDPPGVDRSAIHRQLHSDALVFFRKTFHMPSGGREPPGPAAG